MMPHRSRLPVLLAVLLAVLLVIAEIAPAVAAPRCRFPGPWTRMDQPLRTTAGGPLSPLGIAADPSVLRRGTRYEMWFTNADSRNRTGIARAEGTDGLAWTVWRAPSAPDPVMDLVLAAPPNAWDSPGPGDCACADRPGWPIPHVLYGRSRAQGSVTYAIGMATSPDGVRWTRRDRPVLEPAAAWERPICTTPTACRQGGVLEPSVLYDATARLYRMWYVGLGEPTDSFRTYRIGHATSADGIAWTRLPAPVFALGAPGSWDEMWTSHVNVVADPGGGYHMFYFGSAPGATRRCRDAARRHRACLQRRRRSLGTQPAQPDPCATAWPVGCMDRGRCLRAR